MAGRNELLEWALAYAAKGYRVLPLHTPTGNPARPCSCGSSPDENGQPACSVGKHPRILGWQNEATTDPATIKRWWGMWPRANIGIACGAGTGWFALDVDGAEGEETLRRLEAANSPLPETVEQISGSGGRHLLFQAVEGLTNAVKFAPGLDTRTDGGQVVVEPSLHPNGQEYHWDLAHHPDDMAIAQAPGWLLTAIRKGTGKAKEQTSGQIPEVIKAGQRDALLTSLAGSMRRRMASQEAIEAALMVMNREQCQPPLPEADVQKIARSIGSKPPGDNGIIPPSVVRVAEMSNGIKSLDSSRDLGGPDPDEVYKALDDSIIWGDDLQIREFPVPDQLVPHVMLRGFSSLLAGDSKLGKSSLLLRMMLGMACGGWWLDKDRLAENRLPQSRVLFINFEDPPFVTQDRAKRMMAPEPVPRDFIVIPPPYGYSLPQLLAWIMHAKEKFSLDAVVLDPIAIAAEWEHEDDNAQVALTFKALQRVAYESHLAILSTHHVTKKPGEYGSNIRGASSIKANVLGFHVLERDKDYFRLSGINKATGEWEVKLSRSETDYSWWITETISGSTRTPQQVAKEQFKADLWGCVKNQPGLTVDRLAELCDLKERTCRNYLEELRKVGAVVTAELPRAEGQPGPPLHGWFVAPEEG